MGEPVRREQGRASQPEAHFGPEELYATEVLLIADSAAHHDPERGNGGGGAASAEPLNMESVVRKLIALLSEQQP